MKIGQYICDSIEMGAFVLDGGAMFGVVPKVLWEKKIPPDSKNRIPMSARVLLLQGKERNILVDTGMGSKFLEKERGIYGIRDIVDIDSKLSTFGLKSSEITDVILTHLHFDHAGGATKIVENKIVPTFENATYYVQKEHLEYALSPTSRDRASFIQDNFVPLMEHKVLKTLDGPTILFDDIEIIISNGHTHYQQHPLIKEEGRALFFCGDIFPTASHLPVNWHMGYDNNPTIILKEKASFLQRALLENWIMLFEHDPKIPAATLKKEKNRIVLNQIVEI